MINLKTVGYYSVFLGFCVTGMWVFLLTSTHIEEGKTEMAFHLSSEFAMAFICLISGWQIIKKKSPGKLLGILGHGMLVYSVLNAAGYYGEKGEIPMLIMFMALFFLSVISLAVLFNSVKRD